MNQKKKLNKYQERILKEMHKVICADFSKWKNEPEWYLKYEISEKQKEEFKKWFIDYLYNDSKARREVMRFPSKNKKRIEEVFTWFWFDFGWKENEKG